MERLHLHILPAFFLWLDSATCLSACLRATLICCITLCSSSAPPPPLSGEWDSLCVHAADPAFTALAGVGLFVVLFCCFVPSAPSITTTCACHTHTRQVALSLLSLPFVVLLRRLPIVCPRLFTCYTLQWATSLFPLDANVLIFNIPVLPSFLSAASGWLLLLVSYIITTAHNTQLRYR